MAVSLVRAALTAAAALALASTAACNGDIRDGNAKAQAEAAKADEAAMDRIDALQAEGARFAEAGQWPEALAKWNEGLAIAEKQFGDGPYVELLLTSVGLAHANLGQFDKSEAAYLRAIAMHDRLKLKESGQTATLFLNTGLLYANTGRPAQAEPLLRLALEIARRTPDMDPARIEFMAGSLAAVLRTNGKAAEADAVSAPPSPQPTS